MVKQTVTRTQKKGSSYYRDSDAYAKLYDLLNQGYRVILCTPIGEELEYILEKEIEDK